MTAVVAILSIPLLGVGVEACGDAGKGTASSRQLPRTTATTSGVPTRSTVAATPPGGYLKSDGDNDSDDPGRYFKTSQSDDTTFLTGYGKSAPPRVKKVVATLVKRYYLATVADDGAAMCSLLASSLAVGLTEGSGGPGGKGACAAVVSRLLVPQRQELQADDVATMAVPDVRLKGRFGTAVLGFRAAPMSQLLVKEEAGVWKVDALFDSTMR